MSRHPSLLALSYRCALQEGFADYAAQAGAPNSTYAGVTSFEDAPDDEDDPSPKTEGYVAMLFHDLLDSSPSESDDDTYYSASYVFDVFATCRVRVSGAWQDRDDVSDFVWCLEEGVDSDEHEDQFPGISTPTSVSESATEPSNHDAEDIRNTWHLNLVG